MSNKIVPQIYRSVITEVIDSVKDEFLNFGVDISVVGELQQIWESKLIQSRVADFGSEYGEEGENEDYDEEERFDYSENPAVQTHAANLANAAQGPTSNTYNYPPEIGKPQPYMAPQSPANTTYKIPPSSREERLPQTDGANDEIPQETLSIRQKLDQQLESIDVSQSVPYVSVSQNSEGKSVLEFTLPDGFDHTRANGLRLPQLDGQNDNDDDDEDDAINSDLDDSEDEDDDNADAETTNKMLCQYEKVTRTKNKWKCVLKDGIINVEGRDFLFHKANGDFQF